MSPLPQNAPNAVNADNVAAIASLTIPHDLAAVVRHFTTTADALGATRPSADQLTTMIHQVALLTRQLFPGKLVIETAVDPETRDDVCFAFQVEARGTAEEIAALDRQWHVGLLPITPGWPGLFCLMIDAR